MVAMTPAAMVERTGVPIDTLRYYEKIGLVIGIARGPNGHRRSSEADAEWVEILRCLRLTGMSIQQMQEFAALVQKGADTYETRRELLLAHRDAVHAEMAELRVAMGVIDAKIETYSDLVEAKQP